MQKHSAKMTPTEFLAWEREQPTRHHYIRGEIFDMSGGSARHNGLSVAVSGELRSALKGGSCRVLSSDQRIGLADDVYGYADVAVVCGPLQFRPGTTDVLTNPSVIVEVLSKGTKSYDLSEKQESYLALPSLQHLVFVDQQKAQVMVYSRQAEGGFRYDTYNAGDKVALQTPKVTLSVDEIYAGMFDLPGDE